MKRGGAPLAIRRAIIRGGGLAAGGAETEAIRTCAGGDTCAGCGRCCGGGRCGCRRISCGRCCGRRCCGGGRCRRGRWCRSGRRWCRRLRVQAWGQTQPTQQRQRSKTDPFHHSSFRERPRARDIVNTFLPGKLCPPAKPEGETAGSTPEAAGRPIWGGPAARRPARRMRGTTPENTRAEDGRGGAPPTSARPTIKSGRWAPRWCRSRPP